MHIIWISSHLAFLLGFMYKFGASLLPTFFFFNMLLYALCYRYFLKSKNSPNFTIDLKANSPILNSLRSISIFVILVLLNLYSKTDFFIYISKNPDIRTWFLYRFIDMQGRNPLYRIIATASTQFLIFYTFLLFFVLRKWKLFVGLTYSFVLILDIVAGGRSILINVIFNLGLCFLYFKSYFRLGQIKKFSLKATLFVGIAVFAAIIVTSFYNSDYSFSDASSMVTNRFLAAGDGLEYYMDYDGLHKIKSGFDQYLYSVFGIYIKRFTGVNYKNIGLQLSELVLGELDYTQGANYTFLLQIMVIGYKYFLLYVPIIAFITARLRSVRFKSTIWLPYSFFISATSFLVAEDLEYWVLNVLSGTLFFLIVIYPLNKITFKSMRYRYGVGMHGHV